MEDVRRADELKKLMSEMSWLIPDQPPGQLRIDLDEMPPSSGPDGHFQVQGAPGMRTLVILGRKPTAKRGLAIVAGSTIDLGDVTVDEQPK